MAATPAMPSKLAVDTSESEAASEIARSPSPLCSLAVASSAGGGMTSAVRQSTKTGARTTVGCGEGSEGEGDLVEVRARMSSACTYIREAFASQNGDEGVTRSARGGREGARGVDLPGRDVSLTHSVSLTQTDVHHGQAGS